MQPQTAETPQYAKAGNAYETSTAKPVNPVGLYYNSVSDTYIGTTHEIQGDALIRQGYELVDDGQHTDGRNVGKLTDEEIRTLYKDGKKIVKKSSSKSTSKKADEAPAEVLTSPTDEFVRPPNHRAFGVDAQEP